MWFRHPAWIPVSLTLAVVNLAAVWFAAQPGEPVHATLHAGLAAGFALGARHLMTRRQAGTRTEADLDDAEDLQERFDEMRSHVLELEERVEFAERVLASQRDADVRQVPGRTQGSAMEATPEDPHDR